MSLGAARGSLPGMKAKKAKKAKEPAWPAEAIERRRVVDLVPYARNARVHDVAQVAQIAASIKEWGWTNPILVDEDGGLIAGHGRLLAAQKLGIEEVPCMVARDWTKAQKQAYVIADNQLALDARWDRKLLKVELGDLVDLDFDVNLIGFPDLELKGLLQDDDALGEGYDKLIEKPEDPVAKSGDVWHLGRHRLMCGDSTDENAVTFLLDGAKPVLMVTDPPYGVNYDPSWRHRTGKSKSSATERIQGDDRVDWTEAWKLFPGAVAYVWHSSVDIAEVHHSLLVAGFEVRVQIIWEKSHSIISRGHYHWQHEPCFYAVRKGKSANWIGDHTQTTIWKIPVTDDGDETKHGTQKPIEAMGRPIRNHDADVVYEPFAGSGTTLIACEMLGRQCLAMEIDPGYVDVIIVRWQDRFGHKAKRSKDGKAFDAIAAAQSKT